MPDEELSRHNVEIGDRVVIARLTPGEAPGALRAFVGCRGIVIVTGYNTVRVRIRHIRHERSFVGEGEFFYSEIARLGVIDTLAGIEHEL